MPILIITKLDLKWHQLSLVDGGQIEDVIKQLKLQLRQKDRQTHIVHTHKHMLRKEEKKKRKISNTISGRKECTYYMYVRTCEFGPVFRKGLPVCTYVRTRMMKKNRESFK